MKAVSAIRRGMNELLNSGCVKTPLTLENARSMPIVSRRHTLLQKVCLADVKREALLQHERITASLLNEQAQVVAAHRQRERIGEIVGEPWPQPFRLRGRETLCQRHVKSKLIEHVRIAELREELLLARAEVRAAALGQFVFRWRRTKTIELG